MADVPQMCSRVVQRAFRHDLLLATSIRHRDATFVNAIAASLPQENREDSGPLLSLFAVGVSIASE